MKNIECEVRSFIDKETYNSLLKKFKNEGEFLGKDEQITHYFDSENDLRIQLNNNYCKIWLKKGKLHDDYREEIEVQADKKYFEEMEKLFESLGYKVEIKWYRTRNTFRWRDVEVMIDYTKGYGYILELEKMTLDENKKDTIKYLKDIMDELGVSISTKEEFDDRYQYYKENWRNLI